MFYQGQHSYTNIDRQIAINNTSSSMLQYNMFYIGELMNIECSLYTLIGLQCLSCGSYIKLKTDGYNRVISWRFGYKGGFSLELGFANGSGIKACSAHTVSAKGTS